MKETTPIHGKNMFYDKKHRLLYLDPKTKKTYLLKDNDVKGLYILQNRLLISVFAAIVLYFYMPKPIQVAAISFILYFGLGILMRSLFIPGLQEVTGITKEDVLLPDEQQPEELTPQVIGKVLMHTITATAVSILFILNVMQAKEMSNLIAALHYVLAVGTFGYGIVNLLFLFRLLKIRKNNR